MLKADKAKKIISILDKIYPETPIPLNHKNNFELSLKEARNNFEKDYLISQIKRFNGNIKKISDFTGMERTALYRKFKSLNIETEKK